MSIIARAKDTHRSNLVGSKATESKTHTRKQNAKGELDIHTARLREWGKPNERNQERMVERQREKERKETESKHRPNRTDTRGSQQLSTSTQCTQQSVWERERKTQIRRILNTSAKSGPICCEPIFVSPFQRAQHIHTHAHSDEDTKLLSDSYTRVNIHETTSDRSLTILLIHLTSPKTFAGETHLFYHFPNQIKIYIETVFFLLLLPLLLLLSVLEFSTIPEILSNRKLFV